MGPWLFLLVAAVPSDFLPCRQGLAIEYRVNDTRVIDTVRGPDRHGPHLCRVDRVTVRPDGTRETDAYLREILADRVLAAGMASAPVALRPPLLVGPIAQGTHWQFNRARYRIAEVGPCKVGALDFARCVTVEVAGDDGSKNLSRYAEGVGLVEQRYGDTQMRAIEVRVPKSKSAPKSSGGARR